MHTSRDRERVSCLDLLWSRCQITAMLKKNMTIVPYNKKHMAEHNID